MHRNLPAVAILTLVFAQARDPTARPAATGDPPVAVASIMNTGTSQRPMPKVAPALATSAQDPYLPGQLLVAPPAGLSLEALSIRIGARIVHPMGRSGFGVLEVVDEGRALLALSGSGASVDRLGRTVGAAKKQSSTTLAGPSQWHLAAIGGVPATQGLSSLVVAVLDTGVAYQTVGTSVAVPGLAGSAIVAPADFVEFDGLPLDDHQHGTHIASLIASANTSHRGVAPGVGLMPVKVLDSQNMGTEYALVEGIHHAVDNGADVINMSLSFPLGYLPSAALEGALLAAHDAGVVMVAAAGNDGAFELTYPAASRVVISVGAAPSSGGSGNIDYTPYTNRSPALDILAPGGSMSADVNGDGFGDGLLAETIALKDPARVGLVFYEGTSQATALVTGAVAHLLASGVAPGDVRARLHHSKGGYGASDAVQVGTGADVLNLPSALADRHVDRQLFVGVLPYFANSDGLPLGNARVTVVDGAGTPVVGQVVATLYTAQGISWHKCDTSVEGTCTLRAGKGFGSDAFAYRIDGVVVDGVGHRPSRALFSSDGGAVLLDAVARAGLAVDALAVYYPGGDDPVFGPTLEAWAVVDSGVGLLSSPLGIAFRPSHVAGLSTVGSVTFDVDGTGLLSSPLGMRVTLNTLTLDGSGLLSSPLGARMTLLGISGSGLLSSPLSFHASHLYATSGTGLLSSPLGLGYSGRAVLVGTGQVLGDDPGEVFATLLATEDGLRGDDGYESGTWAAGSGVVEVGLNDVPAVAHTTGHSASL